MSGATGQEQHAVVLSGGGAHGAYGLGVMEALFAGRWQRGKNGPVEPAVFTGTSVGSFNAAFMVSELASQEGPQNDGDVVRAVQRLRQVWLKKIAELPGRANGIFRLRGDPRTYLGDLLGNPIKSLGKLGEDAVFAATESYKRAPKFILSDQSLIERLIEQVDVSSLLSTSPLQQLLTKVVNPRSLLDKGARTLKVATTSWETGRVVVFHNKGEGGTRKPTKALYERRMMSEQDALPAVLASTAIPGIFPPVRIGEESFVDGGLLMNTPLNPAIASGAQTLHVIYVDPELEKLPRGEVRSTLQTTDRLLAVTFAHIKEDIQYAELIKRLGAVGRIVKKEKTNRAADDDKIMKDFIKRFAGIKPIIVHRYYPTRNLGGITGMLDFSQDRLIQMIEMGFDDTVRHDCKKNGCLL